MSSFFPAPSASFFFADDASPGIPRNHTTISRIQGAPVWHVSSWSGRAEVHLRCRRWRRRRLAFEKIELIYHFFTISSGSGVNAAVQPIRDWPGNFEAFEVYFSLPACDNHEWRQFSCSGAWRQADSRHIKHKGPERGTTNQLLDLFYLFQCGLQRWGLPPILDASSFKSCPYVTQWNALRTGRRSSRLMALEFMFLFPFDRLKRWLLEIFTLWCLSLGNVLLIFPEDMHFKRSLSIFNLWFELLKKTSKP